MHDIVQYNQQYLLSEANITRTNVKYIITVPLDIGAILNDVINQQWSEHTHVWTIGSRGLLIYVHLIRIFKCEI